MSPIQQMFLGAGASVATKTYVDDLFSTYLWAGNGSSKTLTNNIDLSSENGGLVWIKNRSSSEHHVWVDTVRGAGKTLESSSNNEEETENDTVSSFSSTGFTVGNSDKVNGSGDNYSSWTFRKAPGFCDVVTYTGNGTSGRTLSHSLGCIPGMIIIKQLNESDEWSVYHRSLGENKYIQLASTAGAVDDSSNGYYWANTAPTATQITLGSIWEVNKNNASYVAYLFAGGEEGYNSVKFDGTGDYLSIPDSSDLDFGSGDYTVECWFRQTGAFQNWRSILAKFTSTGYGSFWIHTGDGGKIAGGYNESAIVQQSGAVTLNTWNHVAISRSGTDWRLFCNGTQVGSTLTESGSNDNNYALRIGDIDLGDPSGREFIGDISNVRITKGQALYTSSFTPSTTPLTQTSQSATSSNVKLLCCNGDLATSSTVTPGTITANGDTNTTGTSPFTSADAVFGENEDQNVIKCGSYVGNGSETAGPVLNLGWEPSFIISKKVSGTGNWSMFDSMRGLVTDGGDPYLRANTNDAESNGQDNVYDLTPTGFITKTPYGDWNTNGETYIYMAIRRPDGYVGKPPSLGTDVFAMATGTSNTPAYSSGFITDLTINRQPASTEDWYIQSRLIGTKYLVTNDTDAEANDSNSKWDYNNGWYGSSQGSNYQAWMWKRHAGFDVVTFKGNGDSDHHILHQMNAVPEMMWLKNRTASGKNWTVFHKGLNGGTDPEDYNIYLNTNAAEVSIGGVTAPWSGTAPTATQFTVGNFSHINGSGDSIIALLFASVDGISKVGSYTGNGSTTERTITLGFQPRFIIIKNADGDYGNSWEVLDTTRGWGSGNDKRIWLDGNWAQDDSINVGAPTSTGFTLTTDYTGMNANNNTYIYYAHA